MIQDYLTGLKALLYLQSREDLANWDGQSPPTERHHLGKPVPGVESVIGKVSKRCHSLEIYSALKSSLFLLF